jgi:hypothetical protein
LPLLDAGARVVAPAKTVVPRNARAVEGLKNWDSYSAEQSGFAEQVYFLELLGDSSGQTQVLLQNAHATRGVSLRFSNRQLPCFSVWKNTTAAADGYVTGLEPGTNFPNPRSFEEQRGRVVQLAAGASSNFDLQLVVHPSADAVAAAGRAVNELRHGREPAIFDQPQADWCAK